VCEFNVSLAEVFSWVTCHKCQSKRYGLENSVNISQLSCSFGEGREDLIYSPQFVPIPQCMGRGGGGRGLVIWVLLGGGFAGSTTDDMLSDQWVGEENTMLWTISCWRLQVSKAAHCLRTQVRKEISSSRLQISQATSCWRLQVTGPPALWNLR